MIAALYVRADGPYASRPDVDAWTVDRDARTYAGPHPVVAHPPCARWGNMWWSARHKGLGLGDDGGCFAAALKAVRRWGGVLEHPEGSGAWGRFGMPRPTVGMGWSAPELFDPGRSCVVDQGRYGHRARKRTWLYWVGAGDPPELDWAPAVWSVEVCLLGRRERELTPPAFAAALLALARAAAQCAP